MEVTTDSRTNLFDLSSGELRSTAVGLPDLGATDPGRHPRPNPWIGPPPRRRRRFRRRVVAAGVVACGVVALAVVASSGSGPDARRTERRAAKPAAPDRNLKGVEVVVVPDSSERGKPVRAPLEPRPRRRRRAGPVARRARVAARSRPPLAAPPPPPTRSRSSRPARSAGDEFGIEG
jgi:hypothetical protein